MFNIDTDVLTDEEVNNITNKLNRECVICLKEFTPFDGRHKTCSPKCKELNYIRHSKRLKKRKTYDERKCTICGNKFMPIRINHYTCSNKCSHQYAANLRKIAQADNKEILHEQVKKYQRTIAGLMSLLYSGIKQRSKNKKFKITMTKEQFFKWINEETNVVQLYTDWVNSDYNTSSKPSVDRINPEFGYNIGNIRLITWADNRAWNAECIKTGVYKAIKERKNKRKDRFKNITFT
tara:strand:+ start:9 stop:716 length:708 start_codon:yes stop_codon:yes gene_type:complete